jgi:CBS domain-containing protein
MLFTVRDLIADAPPLVTVKASDSAVQARSHMLQNDYSQLPVVGEHGKSVGAAVTFRSILNALHNLETTLDTLTVDSVMTPAREVRVDADLLTVLDDIQEKSFLLIVDADRVLKGIVTTFDTTAHFRRYAEDLMVIEDIETMLREAIRSLYNDEDIAAEIQRVVDKKRVRLDGFKRGLADYISKAGPNAGEIDENLVNAAFAQITNDAVKPFDKLTFNELTDVLLRHPNCPTPTVAHGVAGLRNLLQKVRNTRNDLAHFRGEVTAEQRDSLRYCSEWMSRRMPSQQSQTSVPSEAKIDDEGTTHSAETTPHTKDSLGPSAENLDADDSTYAGLAIFLTAQPPDVDARTLSFEEIERVIDYKLPKSASVHRAWWANDPHHVQAAQWLDVGWRAQAINMTDERVTFVRIAEREEAYIHFFSAVLDRLRARPEFPLRSLSPQGVSWHVLAELPWLRPNSADLNASFTRHKTLRVEIYLDAGNAAETKAGYDALYSRKEVIELALGPLSWERMDNKRASRVAVYTPAAISGEPGGLEHAADWVAQKALEFYRVFKPEFELLLNQNTAQVVDRD